MFYPNYQATIELLLFIDAPHSRERFAYLVDREAFRRTGGPVTGVELTRDQDGLPALLLESLHDSGDRSMGGLSPLHKRIARQVMDSYSGYSPEDLEAHMRTLVESQHALPLNHAVLGHFLFSDSEFDAIANR